MYAIEPWHLIVVAIVGVVLFFGWKQLPEMSRSLGRSLRIFKTEIKGTGDEVRTTLQSTVRDARTELTAAADAVRRPAPTRTGKEHSDAA